MKTQLRVKAYRWLFWSTASIILAWSKISQASLKLGLFESGGSSAIVTDFADSGIIFFSGSLGGFTVNVTTALSEPHFSGGDPQLTLNSINARSSGSGSLTIIVSDDTYVGVGPYTVTADYGGTLTGPDDSFVTKKDYYNEFASVPSYAFVPGLPGTGNFLVLDEMFGTGSFSNSNSIGVTSAGTFSLFSITTLTMTGAGTYSAGNDITVQAVPEPTSLALVGIGVFGLFALKPKRRKPKN